MKLKTCYPQTLTRSLSRHGKKLLVFYQKETCGTWAASVLSSFLENYSPGWLLECIYRYIDIYSCEKKSIVSFPVNFLIFLITLSFLSFVLGFTRFPTLMNQREKKIPRTLLSNKSFSSCPFTFYEGHWVGFCFCHEISHLIPKNIKV